MQVFAHLSQQEQEFINAHLEQMDNDDWDTLAFVAENSSSLFEFEEWANKLVEEEVIAWGAVDRAQKKVEAQSVYNDGPLHRRLRERARKRPYHTP